jgi:hypothetical protein
MENVKRLFMVIVREFATIKKSLTAATVRP